MNTSTRITVVLLLVGCSFSALAELVGPSVLNKLKVGEGIVQVGLANVSIQNNANCTYTNYFQFNYISASDKAVFSMLLAAKLSNNDVTLEISDSMCSYGRPFVKNSEIIN